MNHITFVRVAYWFGALIDTVMGTAMSFPPMMRLMLGLSYSQVSVDTRCALSSAAALMFGWTALLIWGSFRPVARRGVLLLTIVPVIAGLALSVLQGFVLGYIPLNGAVRVWCLQAVLVSVFAVAYRVAARSELANDNSAELELPDGY